MEQVDGFVTVVVGVEIVYGQKASNIAGAPLIAEFDGLGNVVGLLKAPVNQVDVETISHGGGVGFIDSLVRSTGRLRSSGLV